jgi:RNA polymerase-binding transcription factor DksA
VVKPTAPKKIETPQSEVVKTAAKLAEIRKAARAQEAKKVQKPVVMPKINATTSRPYQPEFTKSVLDQPNQEYSGPTMRYSDGELVEFRELISRKLEAAKKELSYLHGLITRKDEMSGDETDNRYMTMEDGSLSMEREQLSQMASRQIDFIDKLEKALIRIENKTYGICRVTGKLIDKARLRAVPHATLSMEAKVGMSRNPNVQ